MARFHTANDSRPRATAHASVVLAGLAALAAVSPTGATWAADAPRVDVRRERLLFETREGEAALVEQGLLYGDAALDAYLQSVMDRLYPEFRERGQVRAIKGTGVNAISNAIGNVYVYVGLLPWLRDEAELAAVLGHEGGHILADHLYYQLLDDQRQARGHAIARAVEGRGFDLYFTTHKGFARAQETAADVESIGRLKTAGYETAAATRLFQRMARADAARGVKDAPAAVATHPGWADRAANIAGLTADPPGGERREPEYAAATAKARLEAVSAFHAQRDGYALVACLEEPGRTQDFGPTGEFLLAEGYRLRATEGDERRALEHLDRSIVEHPEVAGAYAARARIHERHGDRAAAIADLEQFLAVEPDSREAAFARQNLDRLRRYAR